jgi:hypothetical protein
VVEALLHLTRPAQVGALVAVVLEEVEVAELVAQEHLVRVAQVALALRLMEQTFRQQEVVEALARLEQLQLEVWVEMVVLVRHQALQEHQLLMPVAVAVVATALAPKARAALVVEVALVQQEQLALLT